MQEQNVNQEETKVASTLDFMTPRIEVVDTVTRDQLENWSNLNQYRFQRPISKGWVSHFKSEMEKGTYRNLCLGLASNGNGGGELLVNGQHSLKAAIEAGWTGKAIIEHYVYNTDDELLTLYSSFDVIKARSVNDMVVGVAADLGIESYAPLLKKLPIAIQQAEKFFTDGLVVPKDYDPSVKEIYLRARYMEWYQEEIEFFTSIYCDRDSDGDLKLKGDENGSNFGNLLSRNLLTAMCICLKDGDPEHAKKFWSDTILYDENTSNEYALRYREFFLSTLGERGPVHKVKVIATAIDSYNRYMVDEMRNKTMPTNRGKGKALMQIKPSLKKDKHGQLTNRLTKPAKEWTPRPIKVKS